MQRRTAVQTAAIAVGLLPLVSLGVQALRDGLGANPIEELTHRTGEATLQLLMATLAVTPLRRWEIALAKSLPPLALGMVALMPGLAIAAWVGVPLAGSLSLFLAASAAALIACLGGGILIATFARNLQQALLIAFFVLFPVMFLSGTIVPVESMPAAMQALSAASPIRYYLEIALGTLLKGVGWSVLWPAIVQDSERQTSRRPARWFASRAR